MPGSEKVDASKGASRAVTSGVTSKVTTTAPPITNIRSGIYAPVMFRNPSTFAGSDMPDKVSPRPNSTPDIKAGQAFILNHPTCFA